MRTIALLIGCLLAAPAAAQVTLTPSGPVTATADGQVIQNLLITASGQDGITVNGRANVTIRNVEIRVSGADGIDASSSPGLIIDTVKIVNTASGVPLPSEQNCIDIFGGTGIDISHAYVERCSTGVYAVQSPGIQVHFLEGHNLRGPFPRGQLFQANNSDNCLLEDFSAVNAVDQESATPVVAWTEDNVSVYQSDGCIVRRGLLDGNNSPSGVGVMFEDAVGGLGEDVDTIRMGNGSFFAYPSDNVTYRRTRARENFCGSIDGRGPSGSNSLMWGVEPSSTGIQILESQYFLSCNGNISWDDSAIDVRQITNADFTLRSPIVLTFPWSGGPPPPQDTTGPTLAWVNPQTGACLVKGSVVGLEATASDPSGVQIVRWFRDSDPTAIRTDSTAPYLQSWTVSFSGAGGGLGTHMLTVQATDTVGNVSEQDITVRVVKRARDC
jgi:Bacterial Ig domain/Right handed beta helix region